MTVGASQLVRQRVFQQRRQQELSGDASDYKRMWQVRAAGLLGAASVGAGAYGAHGLVSHDDEYRAIWKTAVQYHQVHALALLATAAIPSARARAASSACFLTGGAVFCGSNYVVAYKQDRSYGGWAPYGGTGLIGGWLALAAL